MDNSEQVIEIEGLEFRWQPAGDPTLQIDHFAVTRGERIFIKGESGSGKSTLLSLLGGVLTPQRGTITLLGETINSLPGAKRDRFRADHIGFIFQMFNLIPYLSVVENVVLPLHFSKRRRKRVEERHSAGEEAERLLGHLDLSGELLHRPVTELSVGQQQRVAAARALIGSPELVIADEPTSSLDADRRQAFIELLIRECDEAGNTLLFVSHDSSLESHFNHTLPLGAINRAVADSKERADGDR
ncbi:methionine ABC transporter ATP-binding protein [Solemya pervernicosa gill symbiont]|uniref:Methionine ABC transporter ATP-binding protein n=1 Tax=Solemya pervernicosa gill symbiont TaxID=642797 RepID=A0A1T2L7T9_9GAMM|nr:ABC transporter ATP-binding protein [Solemya pervernicosa gill symbiont]OOZ41006.1 methionine ABC transporter ATP-binding protein [Solemya pervernicosa gill symbiont]